MGETMKKIFKEIILYTKYKKYLLQACLIQNLLENKYAVVVVNNVYTYEEMQYNIINKYYFELLQEEFKESCLDWFSSPEEALNNFLNDFPVDS